jgi:hypothetical protein
MGARTHRLLLVAFVALAALFSAALAQEGGDSGLRFCRSIVSSTRPYAVDFSSAARD